MKTIAVLMLLSVLFISCCQTKSVADLQMKYKDENTFTLTLGNALKIIAVSSNAKHYSAKDIRRLKREIRNSNREELMSIKNENGNLQVHLVEGNGKPAKLIMIADNESEGFIALDFTDTK